MPRVYVAGAMSADNILDMLGNISEGVRYGAQLLQAGFAPFVPHLDIAFKLQGGRAYDVPLSSYYGYSLAWLRASDAVLVVPGSENSIGTKNELAAACKLGIPIYHDISTLCAVFSQDSRE